MPKKFRMLTRLKVGDVLSDVEYTIGTVRLIAKCDFVD